MKKILFFSLCMSLTFMASSQKSATAYQAENDGWLVNVDEAYAQSKKTGKPILANFTGSDWCGWCKKLTRSVFVKEEFKTWAKNNVILLELDFPRRKKLPTEIKQQNQRLQQAFGVRGYPTVWMFDLSKKAGSDEFEIEAHGKTGYAPTAAQFIEGLEEIKSKRSE